MLRIERLWLLYFILILAAFCMPSSEGFAANKASAKNTVKPVKIFIPRKYAGLVIGAKSGRILYKENAFEKRRPASLTKMMTLYITFEAIKRGRLKMKQRLKVSKEAASMPRSNMDLKAGSTITVREAIFALIVKSANDISVTLAEAVAGNESKFVAMMNRKAKALGMKNTKFFNPHGWHHEKQYTTAYDMAILARALQRNYPSYFPLFSKKSFTFKGKVIKGHNRVLEKYRGANGLKTGYTSPSGFNIVTSTKRPEGQLIAVVLGGKSADSRDAHVIELLDKSYDKLRRDKINAKKVRKKNKAMQSKKNQNKQSIKPKKQKTPNSSPFLVVEGKKSLNVFEVLN